MSYTPGTVTSIAQLNAELSKIATALQDGLSRKETTGNFMDTDLDMNSKRILNLPLPISETEPARVKDVAEIAAASQGKKIVRSSADGFPEVGIYPEGTELKFYDTLDEYVLIRSESGELQWVEEGNVGDEVDVTAASYLTVAQAQASDLKVGQRLVLTDRDDAPAVVRATGLVANGHNILTASGGLFIEVIVVGDYINPKHFGAIGDGVTDDSLAIQSCLDTGYNIQASKKSTYLVQDLQPQSNQIIRGGKWLWLAGNNAFRLQGTITDVTFEKMWFKGDGVARSSQGAIGCPSGTNTTNWLVDSCIFEDVPFGTYINADTSGTHINPVVRFCTYLRSPRFANDSQSGSGLGLVFSGHNDEAIQGGRSSENTFIECQRHGLYITKGGNVTSNGDIFIRHRLSDGGTYATELGALLIARTSSEVSINYPRFRYCSDTALVITPVQTDGSETDQCCITVNNPIFEGNIASDIRIGSDTPAVNGTASNVNILNMTTTTYGNTSVDRINILSGVNIQIINVTTNAGAATYSKLIRLQGYGDTTETNKISIDGVKGSLPVGATAVFVDTRVCTGSAEVQLSNIPDDLGITYQASVTNTNISEEFVVLQEHPSTSISNPNGIVTARPGRIFLSRSGGTGQTLWVKETTFGSSGWVAK